MNATLDGPNAERRRLTSALLRRQTLIPLAGFLFTVLVGALPELIPCIQGREGHVWTPLNSSRFRAGDSYYYATWTAEIAEGKIPPRNPANTESQDRFAIELFKFVPQLLSAAPALLVSDNRWVYLISLTVFPGLLFLLSYRLARLYLTNPFSCLWVGLAMVFYIVAFATFIQTPGLGSSWRSFTAEPRRLLAIANLDYDYINDNYRFMIPPISACLQLLLLLNLIHLQRQPSRTRAVLTMLLLIAAAFTYLPAAVVCYGYVGGCWLLFLLERDWRRVRLFGCIGLGVGGALLLLDYPGLLARCKANTPFWSAVFENTAPVWDRKTIITYAIHLLALFFLALPGCWRHRELRQSLIVLMVVGLGIIGWTFWKHDLLIFSKLFWRGLLHVWLVLVLIGIALGLNRLVLWLRQVNWPLTHCVPIGAHVVLALLLLAVPAIGFARLGQCNSINPSRFIPEGQWEAYQWLRQNTEPDSVVLAMDWDDIYLLPIYTRNNLFFGHMQVSNHAPQDEVKHYLCAWRALGRPRHELHDLVKDSIPSIAKVYPRYPVYATHEVAESASFAGDLLYWPYAPHCAGMPIAAPGYSAINELFLRAVMTWFDEQDCPKLLGERACAYVLVSHRYYDRLPGIAPERGFTLVHENDCRRIYRLDKDQLIAALAADIRIVTLGDSITRGVRQGVSHQQTFSALLQKELRAGGVAAEVINAGVGGETSGKGLDRLKAEIIRQRPALVLCMYGTNDAYVYPGKKSADTPLDDYRDNLREMVRQLRDAGIQIVLMTPPPWMPDAPPDGNGQNPNIGFGPYVQACREVAAEADVPLVDHHGHWSQIANSTRSIPSWTTDSCHPNAEGHREISRLILPVVKQILTERNAKKP